MLLNLLSYVHYFRRVAIVWKFTRAVSEVWRTYEMKQKPAFVLDLRLPPGSFDVNVTPDKREIFMTGVSAGEVNSSLVQRATSFVQR